MESWNDYMPIFEKKTTILDSVFKQNDSYLNDVLWNSYIPPVCQERSFGNYFVESEILQAELLTFCLIESKGRLIRSQLVFYVIKSLIWSTSIIIYMDF